MAKILFFVFTALMFTTLALAGLAFVDKRADRSEWRRLGALQPSDPPRFDASMIAGLPSSARRYFFVRMRVHGHGFAFWGLFPSRASAAIRTIRARRSAAMWRRP